MDFSIIRLYLKGFSADVISKTLDLKLFQVMQCITDYKNDPYIIRQSKMNYLNQL